MDLTYRLPCIVRPPALMPGQEVLSIFPSVYFTFLWGFFVCLFFYMQLVIHLEFMLAPGGELQSTYLADTNLFPHCLVMPPVPASSPCQAAPCGTRSPVPRGWEHGREAAAAKVRESWCTARPAGPAHRSPHPRPEAVPARGSPCPHTRNSLAVRKLITKGTYLTRERQIASWREVDSCFWEKLSSDGQHDAHKQTCGARTCGVHTCAAVTLL